MVKLVYFLIVTPAALLYRLVRQDPLHLEGPNDDGSYWTAPDRRSHPGSDFRRR